MIYTSKKKKKLEKKANLKSNPIHQAAVLEKPKL